jgi:hypothetical protein
MRPNLFEFQAIVSIKNHGVSIYSTSGSIFMPHWSQQIMVFWDIGKKVCKKLCEKI